MNGNRGYEKYISNEVVHVKEGKFVCDPKSCSRLWDKYM